MKGLRFISISLGLAVSTIILSCSEEPTPSNCVPGIYIDGTYERFCTERTEFLETQFDVSDSLFLAFQRPDSLVLRSSPNYVGYLFSVLLSRPTGTTIEDEVKFYNQLQLLMKPGSSHLFDLNELRSEEHTSELQSH